VNYADAGGAGGGEKNALHATHEERFAHQGRTAAQ
jgi:hypothetical protein